MTSGLILFLSWLLACIAALGSLFFSDIMAYPPCTLCWYQRICMYPLIILLLPAVINYDRKVLQYTLPLTIIGLLISIYHNLIYFNVIDESLSPCSMGVSCKAKFIQWFGFIDIPQLSLLAFVLMTILLLMLKRRDI